MFGFVELSWAYAGFRWVVFGPGLLRAYVYFILGLRWTILGCLGPMLAHLGTMLGVAEVNVAPSWLSVGLS